MTEAYASVNGIPAQSVRLHVGNTGPWMATVDLASDEPVSGRVTITLGTATYVGTVKDAYSGAHDEERRLRIVGGAGAWAAEIPERAYHNDAGVKAKLVAEDAARACGETLGGFVPAATMVGVDYVREAASAVTTLEAVAGPGVAWWVDYAGVTHVGVRTAATADAGGYDVLSYDPRARTAELAVMDPLAVGIGSLIGQGLDTPRTVRELEFTADASGMRLTAWVGGTESSGDRLVGLLRGIIARAMDGRLYGAYRYRVARMSAGRAELQPVHAGIGLPDLRGIEVWPGLGGSHADLTPGSHVLVMFVEGDRAQPVVSHVAPRGGTGWVPVSITIGGESGPPAARQGDAVEVLLPPAVFTGTISGAPVTGVLTFPAMKALGTVTGGSAKVKIAT